MILILFKVKSWKLSTMITSLELICDMNTGSPQLTFKVMGEFWKTVTVMRFLAELWRLLDWEFAFFFCLFAFFPWLQFQYQIIWQIGPGIRETPFEQARLLFCSDKSLVISESGCWQDLSCDAVAMDMMLHSFPLPSPSFPLLPQGLVVSHWLCEENGS